MIFFLKKKILSCAKTKDMKRRSSTNKRMKRRIKKVTEYIPVRCEANAPISIIEHEKPRHIGPPVETPETPDQGPPYPQWRYPTDGMAHPQEGAAMYPQEGPVMYPQEEKVWASGKEGLEMYASMAEAPYPKSNSIFMLLGAVTIGILAYVAYFYYTYGKFPWDEYLKKDETAKKESETPGGGFIKLPWTSNKEDQKKNNPYNNNPYTQ
jgi:hypothetical protein